MIGIICLFTGMGIGILATCAVMVIVRPVQDLPPATEHQIKRAARANRADLRLVQRPMRGMDPIDRLPEPARDFDDGAAS